MPLQISGSRLLPPSTSYWTLVATAYASSNEIIYKACHKRGTSYKTVDIFWVFIKDKMYSPSCAQYLGANQRQSDGKHWRWLKQFPCALWRPKEACSHFWSNLAESQSFQRCIWSQSQFCVFIYLLAPAKMATLIAKVGSRLIEHTETTVRGCRNKRNEGNSDFDCGTPREYEDFDGHRWYIQPYTFKTRSRSACAQLRQWLENPSL